MMGGNEAYFDNIRQLVFSRLDVSREITDDDVLAVIDSCISEYSRANYMAMDDKLGVRRKIFNTIRRLDVLQDLVEDSSITEIMVNGPDNIFIERAGRIIKSDCRIESEEKLLDIIRRIASDVGRVINESKPIVDARLKDGSRVNAVLPPVSLGGPILTIRKFSKEVYALETLIKLESISEEAGDLLKKLVKAGYNLFVSGGTGAGKTTLLNALIACVDKDERIITVEDTNELRVDNPNRVLLEVKNRNTSDAEEISIRRLISTALRMRPDRLVVGEVRGKEAIDMLQALNTGHSGMSTGHSNSARDMLSRIETMILLEEAIPLQAVREQIVSAIDIIVSIKRFPDGSRKVTQIVETDQVKNGEIKLNILYDYDLKAGKLKKLGSLLHKDKLELKGLEAE